MLRHALCAACAVAGLAAEIAQAGEKSNPLAEANTAFAFDLYAQLRGAEGNLFISPLSISSAMAMVYAGAAGATAPEMAAALHFPSDASKAHAGFEALLDSLHESAESGGRLEIANALWADEHYNFREDYIALLEKHYRARADEVDFRNKTEKARQTINAWVAEHTNDKIAELLKPGVLTGDTRLVLTNAVYFKSRWLTPFHKDATEEGPFHGPSGDVPAFFMRSGGKYPYAEHGDCQIVELPYAGETTSMVIILPKSAGGLDKVEAQLEAEWFAQATKKLRARQVHLAIPRFTDGYACRLEKTLADLGMKTPFTARADFSGMDGTRELFLSAVVHETFIEVNEEGTEAAGATGAAVATTSMPAEPPVEFRADHPFIYLIRHRPTGTILFLGRLTEPR